MLRRIKRSIELDAGEEPDSESDTEVFLNEGEEHPLRPKFELPTTKREDLDEPVGPTEEELIRTGEDQRYREEEKRVQEELRNAQTAVSGFLHGWKCVCVCVCVCDTMHVYVLYMHMLVCAYRTKRR